MNPNTRGPRVARIQCQRPLAIGDGVRKALESRECARAV